MKTSLRIFCSMWTLCAMAAPAGESPLFDIPQVEGIAIDGSAEDWDSRGFQIQIMATEAGQILPPEDLDAQVRIGWSQDGLLLLCAVRDDKPVENASTNELWRNDSVELFAGTGQSEPTYYQITIAPGMDEKYPGLRYKVCDRRKLEDAEDINFKAASSRTDDGYILEASLPWKNLPVSPELHRDFAFQVYVHDADSKYDRTSLIWYPRHEAHADPHAMQRIRLARRPGPPVQLAAGYEFEHFRHTVIGIQATPELAGQSVRVTGKNGATLAKTSLSLDAERPSAAVVIPMPSVDDPYEFLDVSAGRKHVVRLPFPNINAMRAKEFMHAEIQFEPFVFEGETFPECDFEKPLLVEEFVGRYRISTTFYDKDYNEVTLATAPGRYGAVVRIVPEHGSPTCRYVTLYRQPQKVAWWRQTVDASMTLPAEMGINPAVLDACSEALGEYLKWRFADGLWHDRSSARLLAGLREYEPSGGKPSVFDDAQTVDRQWWVGLKRKLHGFDKKYSAFVCPKPITGKPAPVLREGTSTEAGMKADSVEKIDRLCEAWAAAETEEAFAVCLARHGVIYLHKAYGERDGKPMTVDTKSWMASITKLLSGTLMMMLVDQGLADLDEPVDRYLPALRDINVEKPVTLRHCYLHIAGLWGGAWGDYIPDFAYRLAAYYPYLEVARQYRYCGTGLTVGGKVIEMISGEVLPRFYRNHLLAPLDCSNTEVVNASSDARSTPLDMAKIGQMLLNRGAYGNMRFFSEKTYEKMLPQDLEKILTEKAPTQRTIWLAYYRGIGTILARDPTLGEGAFGHGAASKATFIVDPTRDMVIVMTRNNGGKDFWQHHAEFLAAIADGVIEKSDK